MGHRDSGSAHSGAQLSNGPSIVRCSAATDELLTTFIERFFLQHLQPRRVGQGSENSGAVQSEECTASQSGKRTVDIACDGSAEGRECGQKAAGCVRAADRALDSAQLKRITLRSYSPGMMSFTVSSGRHSYW